MKMVQLLSVAGQVWIVLLLADVTSAWIRFRAPSSRRNYLEQSPLERLQNCARQSEDACGICGEGLTELLTSSIPFSRYVSINVSDDDIIDAEVAFRVNMQGYFEFRLCELGVDSFDSAKRCRQVSPLTVGKADKYYPGVRQRSAQVQLQLAPGTVCEKCVLQVRYKPGMYSSARNQVFFDCAMVSVYGNSSMVAAREMARLRKLSSAGSRTINTLLPGASLSDIEAGTADSRTINTLLPGASLSDIEAGTADSRTINTRLPGASLSDIEAGAVARNTWSSTNTLATEDAIGLGGHTGVASTSDSSKAGTISTTGLLFDLEQTGGSIHDKPILGNVEVGATGGMSNLGRSDFNMDAQRSSGTGTMSNLGRSDFNMDAQRSSSTGTRANTFVRDFTQAELALNGVNYQPRWDTPANTLINIRVRPEVDTLTSGTRQVRVNSVSNQPSRATDSASILQSQSNVRTNTVNGQRTASVNVVPINGLPSTLNTNNVNTQRIDTVNVVPVRGSQSTFNTNTVNTQRLDTVNVIPLVQPQGNVGINTANRRTQSGRLINIRVQPNGVTGTANAGQTWSTQSNVRLDNINGQQSAPANPASIMQSSSNVRTNTINGLQTVSVNTAPVVESSSVDFDINTAGSQRTNAVNTGSILQSNIATDNVNNRRTETVNIIPVARPQGNNGINTVTIQREEYVNLAPNLRPQGNLGINSVSGQRTETVNVVPAIRPQGNFGISNVNNRRVESSNVTTIFRSQTSADRNNLNRQPVESVNIVSAVQPQGTVSINTANRQGSQSVNTGSISQSMGTVSTDITNIQPTRTVNTGSGSQSQTTTIYIDGVDTRQAGSVNTVPIAGSNFGIDNVNTQQTETANLVPVVQSQGNIGLANLNSQAINTASVSHSNVGTSTTVNAQPAETINIIQVGEPQTNMSETSNMNNQRTRFVNTDVVSTLQDNIRGGDNVDLNNVNNQLTESVNVASVSGTGIVTNNINSQIVETVYTGSDPNSATTVYMDTIETQPIGGSQIGILTSDATGNSSWVSESSVISNAEQTESNILAGTGSSAATVVAGSDAVTEYMPETSRTGIATSRETNQFDVQHQSGNVLTGETGGLDGQTGGRVVNVTTTTYTFNTTDGGRDSLPADARFTPGTITDNSASSTNVTFISTNDNNKAAISSGIAENEVNIGVVSNTVPVGHVDVPDASLSTTFVSSAGDANTVGIVSNNVQDGSVDVSDASLSTTFVSSAGDDQFIVGNVTNIQTGAMDRTMTGSSVSNVDLQTGTSNIATTNLARVNNNNTIEVFDNVNVATATVPPFENVTGDTSNLNDISVSTPGWTITAGTSWVGATSNTSTIDRAVHTGTASLGGTHTSDTANWGLEHEYLSTDTTSTSGDTLGTAISTASNANMQLEYTGGNATLLNSSLSINGAGSISGSLSNGGASNTLISNRTLNITYNKTGVDVSLGVHPPVDTSTLIAEQWLVPTSTIDPYTSDSVFDNYTLFQNESLSVNTDKQAAAAATITVNVTNTSTKNHTLLQKDTVPDIGTTTMNFFNESFIWNDTTSTTMSPFDIGLFGIDETIVTQRNTSQTDVNQSVGKVIDVNIAIGERAQGAGLIDTGVKQEIVNVPNLIKVIPDASLNASVVANGTERQPMPYTLLPDSTTEILLDYPGTSTQAPANVAIDQNTSVTKITDRVQVSGVHGAGNQQGTQTGVLHDNINTNYTLTAGANIVIHGNNIGISNTSVVHTPDSSGSIAVDTSINYIVNDANAADSTYMPMSNIPDTSTVEYSSFINYTDTGIAVVDTQPSIRTTGTSVREPTTATSLPDTTVQPIVSTKQGPYESTSVTGTVELQPAIPIVIPATVNLQTNEATLGIAVTNRTSILFNKTYVSESVNEQIQDNQVNTNDLDISNVAYLPDWGSQVDSLGGVPINAGISGSVFIPTSNDGSSSTHSTSTSNKAISVSITGGKVPHAVNAISFSNDRSVLGAGTDTTAVIKDDTIGPSSVITSTLGKDEVTNDASFVYNGSPDLGTTNVLIDEIKVVKPVDLVIDKDRSSTGFIFKTNGSMARATVNSNVIADGDRSNSRFTSDISINGDMFANKILTPTGTNRVVQVRDVYKTPDVMPPINVQVRQVDRPGTSTKVDGYELIGAASQNKAASNFDFFDPAELSTIHRRLVNKATINDDMKNDMDLKSSHQYPSGIVWRGLGVSRSARTTASGQQFPNDVRQPTTFTVPDPVYVDQSQALGTRSVSQNVANTVTIVNKETTEEAVDRTFVPGKTVTIIRTQIPTRVSTDGARVSRGGVSIDEVSDNRQTRNTAGSQGLSQDVWTATRSQTQTHALDPKATRSSTNPLVGMPTFRQLSESSGAYVEKTAINGGELTKTNLSSSTFWDLNRKNRQYAAVNGNRQTMTEVNTNVVTNRVDGVVPVTDRTNPNITLHLNITRYDIAPDTEPIANLNTDVFNYSDSTLNTLASSSGKKEDDVNMQILRTLESIVLELRKNREQQLRGGTKVGMSEPVIQDASMAHGETVLVHSDTGVQQGPVQTRSIVIQSTQSQAVDNVVNGNGPKARDSASITRTQAESNPVFSVHSSLLKLTPEAREFASMQSAESLNFDMKNVQGVTDERQFDTNVGQTIVQDGSTGISGRVDATSGQSVVSGRVDATSGQSVVQVPRTVTGNTDMYRSLTDTFASMSTADVNNAASFQGFDNETAGGQNYTISDTANKIDDTNVTSSNTAPIVGSLNIEPTISSSSRVNAHQTIIKIKGTDVHDPFAVIQSDNTQTNTASELNAAMHQNVVVNTNTNAQTIVQPATVHLNNVDATMTKASLTSDTIIPQSVNGMSSDVARVNVIQDNAGTGVTSGTIIPQSVNDRSSDVTRVNVIQDKAGTGVTSGDNYLVAAEENSQLTSIPREEKILINTIKTVDTGNNVVGGKVMHGTDTNPPTSGRAREQSILINPIKTVGIANSVVGNTVVFGTDNKQAITATTSGTPVPETSNSIANLVTLSEFVAARDGKARAADLIRNSVNAQPFVDQEQLLGSIIQQIRDKMSQHNSSISIEQAKLPDLRIETRNTFNKLGIDSPLVGPRRSGSVESTRINSQSNIQTSQPLNPLYNKMPERQRLPNSLNLSPEVPSAACADGERYVCHAVGKSATIPGMVWWCFRQCKAGNCPPSKCRCKCEKVMEPNASADMLMPKMIIGKAEERKRRVQKVITLTLNGTEETTVPVAGSLTSHNRNVIGNRGEIDLPSLGVRPRVAAISGIDVATLSEARLAVLQCVGINAFRGTDGIDQWCTTMCRRKECPANICACQ